MKEIVKEHNKNIKNANNKSEILSIKIIKKLFLIFITFLSKIIPTASPNLMGTMVFIAIDRLFTLKIENKGVFFEPDKIAIFLSLIARRKETKEAKKNVKKKVKKSVFSKISLILYLFISEK